MSGRSGFSGRNHPTAQLWDRIYWFQILLATFVTKWVATYPFDKIIFDFERSQLDLPIFRIAQAQNAETQKRRTLSDDVVVVVLVPGAA